MNEQVTTVLHGTPLFAGFTQEEIRRVLAALAPQERAFEAGDILLMAGYETRDIGIVLAGGIEAAKGTRAGAQFTVAHMGPGGVFGDVLSAGRTKSPVTVTARSAGRVLLVPYARLLKGRTPLHARLLANLVAELSAKYFALDRRIDLLLLHPLRRRIAAFLLDAARTAGADTFTVPFTRTALASYLGCERSALSREISRMAADGLLETWRSGFRLPAPERLRALL